MKDYLITIDMWRRAHRIMPFRILAGEDTKGIVWRIIAEELSFDYKTLGQPIDHPSKTDEGVWYSAEPVNYDGAWITALQERAGTKLVPRSEEEMFASLADLGEIG